MLQGEALARLVEQTYPGGVAEARCAHDEGDCPQRLVDRVRRASHDHRQLDEDGGERSEGSLRVGQRQGASEGAPPAEDRRVQLAAGAPLSRRRREAAVVGDDGLALDVEGNGRGADQLDAGS